MSMKVKGPLPPQRSLEKGSCVSLADLTDEAGMQEDFWICEISRDSCNGHKLIFCDRRWRILLSGV